MIEQELFHDGLRFLQTNRAFLGREFLTWIWFLCETQSHKINVPGYGDMKLYLDDKLVLSSSGGSVHENSLRGGTPAYADEAKAALLAGKLVQEAKFILQDVERQWMWSMRAEDLSLRGVRLPSLQAPDAATHIAQRVTLMQTLVDVIDHLFKTYMDLRLSKRFDVEIARMGDWMNQKETNAMSV